MSAQTDGQYAIIIGGEDMLQEKLYTFHDKDNGHEIARGYFADDLDAVAWFSNHYIIEYRRGVEMRVYA